MAKEQWKQCTDASGKALIVAHKVPGFLYFVDTDGKVMNVPMESGKKLTPEEIKRRAKEKADNKAKREKDKVDNKAKKLANAVENEKKQAKKAKDRKEKKLALIAAADARAAIMAKKREDKRKELQG